MCDRNCSSLHVVIGTVFVFSRSISPQPHGVYMRFWVLRLGVQGAGGQENQDTPLVTTWSLKVGICMITAGLRMTQESINIHVNEFHGDGNSAEHLGNLYLFLSMAYKVAACRPVCSRQRWRTRQFIPGWSKWLWKYKKVSFLVWKEPELLSEVERHQKAIAGLTSGHSLHAGSTGGLDSVPLCGDHQ